jgi:hypothetical protein
MKPVKFVKEATVGFVKTVDRLTAIESGDNWKTAARIGGALVAASVVCSAIDKVMNNRPNSHADYPEPLSLETEDRQTSPEQQ